MTTVARQNRSLGQPRIVTFEVFFKVITFVGLCFSIQSSEASYVHVALVLTAEGAYLARQQLQNDNVGDKRLEGEEDVSSLRKEVADLQEVL